MKILMSLILLSSVSALASDCSDKIEAAITAQYPYDTETMSMEIKKLGPANIGHRFVNTRYTTEMDVYSAGTSDEGGGILYVASVVSKTCEIVSLNNILQQDD